MSDRVDRMAGWVIRRAVSAWILMGVVLWAPVAHGQLQLESPEIPARFYTDALISIEQQIAALNQRADDVDVPTRLILDSQKNLRMVARQLILTGRDAGDRGAIAVLSGLIIISGADDFDQLTTPLPGKVIEAFNAGEAKATELAHLRRAVEALRQFNDRVDTDLNELKLEHTSSVDVYLHRMLSPLAVVAEVLDAPTPVNTWTNANAAAGQDDQAALTSEQLDLLLTRAEKAPLTEATVGEIRWLITMMAKGLAEPDIRPRVHHFHVRLSQIIDIAEGFNRAQWLDDLTRQQFQSHAHTAVLLFKDPRTRDSAEARISQLARMQQLLLLMNELSQHQDIDITPMQQVFMVAYQALGNENTIAVGEQLTALLQRLAMTALAQRNMQRVEQLPMDVRRAQQVLMRRYVTLERQMITALPGLAENPGEVTQPRWTQPLGQLEQVSLEVRYLNRVPEWVQRMANFNSHAARGLYQQLRMIADDLLSPATHAGASAALLEMERQLALFESLPHEEQLDDADSLIASFLKEHRDDIRRQLLLLRSQWSAAWGAGADPTPAGRNLLLLRRLMTTTHDGGRVISQADALTKLNRWGGWLVPESAIQPLKQWLPGELSNAATLAGAGNWPQLELALDRMDRQGPTVWLMVHLLQQVGSTLENVPEGFAGVLSQTLYPPPTDTIDANHRMDLARLSVTLTAAASERQRGATAGVQLLMDHAGDLARQLLKALVREQPSAAPTAPADAIDV